MGTLRVLRTICVAAAVGAAVCAVATPSASAGLLSCGATYEPFARFGDDGNYFLVPNGDFESGSTGWTLSRGASVGAGNEPYDVSGPGKSSLHLAPGSTALGPKTCVNLFTPHARMFVAQAGTHATSLGMQVVFYGVLGNTLGILNYDAMGASEFSAWQPSDTVSSSLGVPLLTSYMRIKLTAGSSGDGVVVDDVHEDPWVNGMG